MIIDSVMDGFPLMRRVLISLCLTLLTVWPLTAQNPTDSLTLTPPELTQGVSAFGESQWMAVGTLTVADTATDALTDTVLYATVYDEAGEIIGEGFGGAVDACGLSFRPDAPLQPGEVARYQIGLELDRDDLTPDRLDIEISATPTDATPVNPFLTYPHVTELHRGEVVRLEWSPEGLLRFAVGCELDLFTAQQWYEYDPVAGDTRPIDPPNGESIDDAVLNRLELENPADAAHAKIQFHPGDRRLIYQDDINVILTAEPDGTFQRLLWDALSRISLQGYTWLAEGRFLAYYYGAYGDEVRYFTGSMAGQKISQDPLNVVPSLIVPGATPDGARVVIAIERDGVEVYRLQSTINISRGEDLFEGEAPGNNFPAPLYVQGERGAFIYLVREVGDGGARLQCFWTATDNLTDLALLPLSLAPDERGLMTLSPDQTTLALASEGRKGGVWIIDMTALPCAMAS